MAAHPTPSPPHPGKKEKRKEKLNSFNEISIKMIRNDYEKSITQKCEPLCIPLRGNSVCILFISS